MQKTLLISLLALACAGCGHDAPEPAPASEPKASAPVSAPAAPVAEQAAASATKTDAAIRVEDYAHWLKTVSSDAFEGRGPGSKGETVTVEYLEKTFRELGLTAGNGESFRQAVPMVEVINESRTPLEVTFADGRKEVFNFPDDVVVGTLRNESSSSIAASELVFAGYGVNAPELGWNDYEGLDVKGKTVIVLVNDPGFAVGDESLFRGKAMTYYGRWTYKFEEAVRQGAAGCLIVHEDKAASYGWEVVVNSWSGPEFDLPSKPGDSSRLPIQGWLSQSAAKRLLAAAGQDLDAQTRLANAPGFKPVALGAKASVAVSNRTRSGDSQNVVGMVRGSERPDEYLIYMAHWDHLGRSFGSPDGDGIYNGAIDNGTGLAGLLELAEATAKGKPPARSVVFLAVTLEESGLLGSRYYAQNPLFPLAQTVAVINMDALPVIGRTRDVVVVGHGGSELEGYLAEAAKAQNRIIVPEPTPENGFYYRSDHFNFAKFGVPALYAKGGIDHIEKGDAYGREVMSDYNANRYHKTGDEFDPSWDLTGVVQDVQLLLEVGNRIAQGKEWPNWYEGNEFRAARDASLQAAKGN